MARQTKLERRLTELAAQRDWIASCGGDHAGYIARYGDPDIPPLDDEGNPKTVVIPPYEVKIRAHLTPVPDKEDTFFLPCSGNGGTAIWQADYAQLRRLEQEVEHLLAMERMHR